MKTVAKMMLLVIWAGSLCGCITGRPSTFARVKMTIFVMDSATKKPIPNAVLKMVAVGNHTGRIIVWDGFTTDSTGRCDIEAPSRTTWIGGSEAFAGGFTRTVTIAATGYQDNSFEEFFYDRTRREFTDQFKSPNAHVVEMRALY